MATLLWRARWNSQLVSRMLKQRIYSSIPRWSLFFYFENSRSLCFFKKKKTTNKLRTKHSATSCDASGACGFVVAGLTDDLAHGQAGAAHVQRLGGVTATNTERKKDVLLSCALEHRWVGRVKWNQNQKNRAENAFRPKTHKEPLRLFALRLFAPMVVGGHGQRRTVEVKQTAAFDAHQQVHEARREVWRRRKLACLQRTFVILVVFRG